MKQILLKYDEQNSIAKKTIDYIRSLGIFEVEEKEEKILALDKSLQEAAQGKVNSYESVDDFFRKIS